ncbi:hypothetical protein AS156_00950 [Bradyrhizobium macuxiense]|uniref:Helix-turn-helix domain-containing protein n=1 Tax=Bradyrhizobium macuxiense TaxID=1755647 RepID=A0A109JSG2_9BRAD|nr:hypothetical protein AS156_00950 [Bradyrhizobium macuxiense]
MASIESAVISSAKGIAECLAAALPAEEHHSTTSTPSWMTEFRSGEILTTVDAATILNVTSQAVRLRCERSDDDGSPIGLRFAGTWLVSRRLLLDQIERNNGLHARRVVEGEAEKLSKLAQSKVGSLKI